MPANPSNGFILLIVETVPDTTAGRRLMGLGSELNDEDARKALDCVARNDTAFAQYWVQMQRVVAVYGLLWDGLAFTLNGRGDFADEASCLQELENLCCDAGSEVLLVGEKDTLLSSLHLRAMQHEIALPALFSGHYQALTTILPALGTEAEFPRLLACDFLGIQTDWLVAAALQEVCRHQDVTRLEQHCRAKTIDLCRLFLRIWLASGAVSTVKYRHLSRALDALV